MAASTFDLVRVEIQDDVRIYFDTSGEALVPDEDQMRERPTVLSLHGGPGADHSSSKPEFSRLADVAQVVYMDQRGQDRSDRRPQHEWTLDTWADDVVRFCEATGIDHPIVVGTSFGGMVAQHYASRHPAHPASLVLISTMARFDLDASVQVFRRLGGEEAAYAAYTDVSEATRERYFEIC